MVVMIMITMVRIPILVTLVGIVIDVSAMQSEKTKSSITVIFDAMSTYVKFLHCAKAPFSNN